MKFPLILVSILAFALTGCDQVLVRSGFSNMTINLPCGHKYVNASWKEAEIWYATRPANPGETFVTVTYKQQTPVNILSGSVMFVESACLSKSS